MRRFKRTFRQFKKILYVADDLTRTEIKTRRLTAADGYQKITSEMSFLPEILFWKIEDLCSCDKIRNSKYYFSFYTNNHNIMIQFINKIKV